MSPQKPMPDIDALARRIPSELPSPERSRAMRSALINAATQAPPRVRWWRRWVLGLALGGALPAAAALLLWLRAGGAPTPTPRPPAVATARPALTGTTPTPALTPTPTPTPEHTTPAPEAWPTELADGTTVFETSHTIQWTEHDTALTAPANARFVVVAQDHRIRSIVVMRGWVEVAAARQPVRRVAESEVWQIELSPPVHADPAPARRTTPAHVASPARVAERPPVQEPPAPQPAPQPTPTANPAPSLGAYAAAERAYRDGLRSLLAGNAKTAIAALAQACAAIDAPIEDSCYWAAVAAQRLGDPTRARRGYDDFLRRWPGSTHAGEAHLALGWLLLDAGEPGAARAQFAAAASDPLPTVRNEARRGLATIP